MNIREMDKLTAHFDKYFEQSDSKVLHLTVETTPHIDVLIYSPNEKYPFWKLATMGASDYKMPKITNTFSDRNEYIMFVDSSVDLNDLETVNFYHNMLMEVAYYSVNTKTAITYSHSMEWGEAEDSDMVGAFIEMPQIIENSDILRCKLGLFKTVTCLQVVLLTRDEIDRLLQIGPRQFSDFLYPEEDGAQAHFLSEQRRSEKF